jgi:hypothetical protein
VGDSLEAKQQRGLILVTGPDWQEVLRALLLEPPFGLPESSAATSTGNRARVHRAQISFFPDPAPVTAFSSNGYS